MRILVAFILICGAAGGTGADGLGWVWGECAAYGVVGDWVAAFAGGALDDADGFGSAV